MAEAVYEMLWDCGYCGTQKLLGKTHRFCPGCGAAQDANARYFPEEDEKVAVHDHKYVGADLVCAHCGTPCSRAANNCGSCGAALGDDDADATLLVDQLPTPAPRRNSKGSLFAKIAFAAVFAIIIFGLTKAFWKKEVDATLSGHSWERSIALESYRTVQEGEFCDSLPAGARIRSRSEKKRGSEKIEDGESCSTKRVDQGDGTYKEVQKCSPKYREEPIMEPYCDYEIDRWVSGPGASTSGKGLEPAPTWPELKTTGCRTLGCTRSGARKEVYRLHFKMPEGETKSCAVSQSTWSHAKIASTWTLKVGMLDGALDCSALTAKRGGSTDAH